MMQIEAKGMTKVVDERELEIATEAGWRLVAIVQEQVVEYAYGDDQKIVKDAYGNVRGATWTENPRVNEIRKHGLKAVPITGTRTRYVVTLDEESALRRAADALEAAKRELTFASAAIDKVAADRDMAQKKIEAAEVAAKEIRAELDRKAIDIKALRAADDSRVKQLRAMEIDLGKVREAIGGDRMREIVGR